MSIICRIMAIALLGMLLAAFTAGTACAQSAFGTVDVERAFNESQMKADLEKSLEAEVKQVTQWLQLRSANKLLTDDEFKQLFDLTVKPNASEEEKKKIEELQALSKQREATLQTLEHQTSVTDDEQKQLNDLRERAKSSQAAIDEELRTKDEQLGQKRVDLSKKVMQEVEAAVAAVAKEKKLTLVFSKQYVIYSGTDITEDVIKRLKK